MSSVRYANAPNQAKSLLFWSAWAGIILVLYLHTGAWRLLNSPPAGNHAWASCDRAAQAWMFYQDQASLWFPATNYIGHHPSGIDAGEFPLMPWLAAGLYRLFGPHDTCFRYLTLGFSLIGFWVAARITRQLIPNPWVALMASTMWLFSPNVIYYSVGYLPDPIAITAFLSGIWAGMNGKPRFLGAGSFSLAILLKFNFLILYLAWVTAGIWTDPERRSPGWLVRRLRLLLPVIPGGAWIGWTWYLKSIYHGHVFTTSARLPASLGETLGYFHTFWQDHLAYLFPQVLGVCWFMLVTWLGIRAMMYKRRFGLVAWIGMGGWLVFFWMMGHLSPHHHYYHLILGPILFIATVELGQLPVFTQRNGIFLAIGIVLVMLVWSSWFLPSTFRKTAFHIDGIHSGWYSLGTFLESRYIPEDATVFTYADPSPNISLYLMRRRGVNGNTDYPAWYIIQCMEKCDYAVLTDPNLFKIPEMAPLMESYLGGHKGLHLYKLKHGNLAPVP